MIAMKTTVMIVAKLEVAVKGAVSRKCLAIGSFGVIFGTRGLTSSRLYPTMA
jgi:hypothetical protein